jgi:6-pyruvoyltetrahydropterin/6-carboxytetrahydropterin synthase
MKPLTLTVAAGEFEAARQVDGLPPGHRLRGLHGHGFRAAVFAQLPEGWAAFPGGEALALRARLGDVLQPLNYGHLNQVIEQPTDVNIARWIEKELALPGVNRIALQSTAQQGVDLDRNGMAQVWRRYKFQAAHRLPHVPLGHKCGRMHGHGFEVILHATQDLGQRAPAIDHDQLDAAWAPLHFELNCRCLNEIAGLENPTSELIASWLWRRLKSVVPELSWVTVYETATCGAHFDGASYRIWKDFSIDSAVQLKRAPAGAPQGAIHGHTFTLRLHLLAPLDPTLGWTTDFGDVKTAFAPLFEALDHMPLYESALFSDNDPASIASWVYRAALPLLPQVVRVDLFESAGGGSVVTSDIDGPALPAWA